MNDTVTVKPARALLSVSDKTGLVELGLLLPILRCPLP